MTHSFKLSRRIARLRAPVLAAFVLAALGCDSADSLNPEDSITPDPVDQLDSPLEGADGEVEVLSIDGPTLASVSFAGGIPIGTFNQPNSQFGTRYNGALRNIWPDYLRSNLAAIKSRGGKVVLDMAGNQRYFRDASGHFSMSKWKARIDRFRRVDINSYINDGTIIGHYLIDEPNDASNWSGRPVSPSTVEEMAKYSKQIWPGMATIVRAEPTYMDNWSGSYRYLNAAWAQYVSWKGSPGDFLRKNVSAAQRKGLALVVGLNISKGGYRQSRMSASQVRNWGSAMLSSSYPCAFLSWQYNSDHLSSSSMKDAMSDLRRKAQNRSTKSCR